MADRFVRTEAGRREIRERQLSLSRAARNLLLVIDASKPAPDWLALVAGSTAADLAALRDAGLIAPSGDDAPRAALTLAQALQARSYRELYDLLTQQARPRLGLIRGYRMVLEVEKCNGADEIRALAQRFVDLVRDVQGEAEAQALRRQLGADS
jgi:hypothetical protein